MAENNPRVVFERLFGSSDSTDARVRASRLRQDRSILDSVTVASEAASADAGSVGQHEAERLSGVTPGHRAPNPEGRGAEHEAGPRRGAAGRCARRVRAARAAALRPAGAGLSVRSDEGDHVHVRPRADRPSVSSDRDSRTASSTDAPSERRREDGEVHRDSAVSRRAVRRRIWRSCRRPRTATARCSIT